MLRCYYYHLFYICTIYKSDSGTLFIIQLYEGWNFNSGNYLFTTDTK